MSLQSFWKLLLVMFILSAGMVVCIVLHSFYNIQYTREAGFVFMVGSLAILLILILKLRKTFIDPSTSYGSKTWRSYPVD